MKTYILWDDGSGEWDEIIVGRKHAGRGYCPLSDVGRANSRRPAYYDWPTGRWQLRLLGWEWGTSLPLAQGVDMLSIATGLR